MRACVSGCVCAKPYRAYDGAAAVCELRERVNNVICGLRIEAGGGLIQKHQLRVKHHFARNCHSLPFTTWHAKMNKRNMLFCFLCGMRAYMCVCLYAYACVRVFAIVTDMASAHEKKKERKKETEERPTRDATLHTGRANDRVLTSLQLQLMQQFINLHGGISVCECVRQWKHTRQCVVCVHIIVCVYCERTHTRCFFSAADICEGRRSRAV